MNKNESKYFNTAHRMDEALISLLDKKDLEYITVKDICEKAEVNRSTFYLHYETVEDLLTETMDYMNEQFQSYFAETAQDIISGIPEAPLQDLVFVREKYLVPYLTYIKDHKTVFRVSFSQKKAMQSAERYHGLYSHIIEPILNRFQVPEKLRAYYNAFFMQGTLGVIRKWLNGGCLEDADEIARIIEELCTGKK